MLIVQEEAGCLIALLQRDEQMSFWVWALLSFPLGLGLWTALIS